MRVYPWGRAEAMSSVHSDLPSLTQLLFELAPETLKAATEARYYHLRRLMLQAGTPSHPHTPAIAGPLIVIRSPS